MKIKYVYLVKVPANYVCSLTFRRKVAAGLSHARFRQELDGTADFDRSILVKPRRSISHLHQDNIDQY